MYQFHAHNSNNPFLIHIILKITINGSLETTLALDIHEMELEVEKSWVLGVSPVIFHGSLPVSENDTVI